MAPSGKRKLFVGGVPSQTNENALREYFTRFGTVEEALIIRDRATGAGRGFAFVKFADSSRVQEALKHDNHVILGKKVDVKPAIAKDYRQEQSNGEGNNEFSTKKIFVGGLPPDLTEEELRSYFESFGTIADAVIICEKESRRPRGFGFITFESEDDVDNVLKNRYHELKQKKVEVKRAQPKYRNDRSMNYYKFYETGPHSYACIYRSSYYYYPLPYEFYHGWNPYGTGALNGVCGSFIASNPNGSSPSPLSLGNPAVHPSYVSYPSYGAYQNGWASCDVDSTNCNGVHHQIAEPIANGALNGDYDNDTPKVPETMKLPQVDDLPQVKNNVVEPQDGEIGDLSSSKSIDAEHQRDGTSNGDYDNGASKVPETMKLPQVDDLPHVKNNVVELQDGEIDDLSSSKSMDPLHQRGDVDDSAFKEQCAAAQQK